MQRSADAIRSEAIAAIQAVTCSAVAAIHDLISEELAEAANPAQLSEPAAAQISATTNAGGDALTGYYSEEFKENLKANSIASSAAEPNATQDLRARNIAVPSASDLDAIAQEDAARAATSVPDATGSSTDEQAEEPAQRAVPRLSPNELIRSGTGQPAPAAEIGAYTPNDVLRRRPPTPLKETPDGEDSAIAAPSASTADEAAQPEGDTGNGEGVAAVAVAPVA